jgi:hypothetical protein
MRTTNEQDRIDAQSKCVRCKLCGGAAKITDAGAGWGYYIACENASGWKVSCLCGEVRKSGNAYNVQKLWNRLHGEKPSPSRKPHVEGADKMEDILCEQLSRPRFKPGGIFPRKTPEEVDRDPVYRRVRRDSSSLREMTSAPSSSTGRGNDE